ncbi:hypothetical protein SERLA73DRAFT_122832 [Serpula lacrymans var. lacrymans S7.3]|uniref:Uncharacterized protein n=1 Tax=Serpula lacrymans var. lacrymans (strain S7.3) TaxID=936435 RepID=F8PYL0_SERL3|nr:hypothetical protein SERLA73DRAFT_122832 [Serpula lacrymans var. lacrymans S7.3]
MAVLILLPNTLFLRRTLLPLTLYSAIKAGLSIDISCGNLARAHSNQGYVVSTCW